MSLLGSLQIANNSLLATQIGLQVIGNNVANSNTPGYSRQDVVYEPAPIQMVGTLPIGLGVQVRAIIQHTDRFLNERLRGAISDVENTEAQKQSYLQLESIIGELSETDLSSSLSQFFASINDVLNQPEDLAVRNLTRLQAESLAQDIQRLDDRVNQIRIDVNNNIVSAANDINRLLEQVAKLNIQIVTAEGGDSSGSDAGSLRDQRTLALNDLSKIIGLRVIEQDSGAVTVYANGDYLVFDGQARAVTVEYSEDRGLSVASINIVDSDSPIDASTGKLSGLYAARDEVLGGFLDNLDDFAQNLIFEFNKVFSSGQGLTGYDSVTSEFQVSNAQRALDQAGLDFTPVNGTFQILVKNKRTELTTTSDIRIDLNGLDDDTDLEDLAEQLNAIDGISAQVNTARGLDISADSGVIEFAFANDTSGILAALGINTFFSGTGSDDIGVSEVIASDPTKFTSSRGGIGEDSENAVLLAGLANAPLEATGGRSLIEYYERFTGEMFQASATVQAVNDGFRTFQKTLEGQQLGISGVSVDEQAVKMIQHQRIFQASARLISAINELLEVLVNL
jgi:flagellar hook-associated protein 1 FlgK